jgi:hypothetical protein
MAHLLRSGVKREFHALFCSGGRGREAPAYRNLAALPLQPCRSPSAHTRRVCEGRSICPTTTDVGFTGHLLLPLALPIIFGLSKSCCHFTYLHRLGNCQDGEDALRMPSNHLWLSGVPDHTVKWGATTNLDRPT